MRKRDKPHKSYGQFLLCLSGMLFFVNSCGVVGSPIPPENIGIEAKIRAQKKAEKEKVREAEEIFKEAEEAYSVLSNAKTRKLYDMENILAQKKAKKEEKFKEAQEKIKEAQEAYSVLGNAKTRKLYDMENILAQKKVKKEEKFKEAEGEQTQNNKKPLVTKRDYYEVLGTSPNASDNEIKKAFRKISRQHHLDLQAYSTVTLGEASIPLPPLMTKRDYYEVLGASPDASDDEIEKAFRKISRQHHLDLQTYPTVTLGEASIPLPPLQPVTSQ